VLGFGPIAIQPTGYTSRRRIWARLHRRNQPMPAPLELDEAERAALVALLRAQIKNTRWPLAPRMKALRAILDKLEPPPPRPEPFPRPKPPAQPSALLAKKRRR